MCDSLRLQTPNLSHSAFGNKRCARSGAWVAAVSLLLRMRLARLAETSSSMGRQARSTDATLRKAAYAHRDDQAAAEGLPAV